jgi:glycosyltransferase involved in cell wall biosynthesis
VGIRQAKVGSPIPIVHVDLDESPERSVLPAGCEVLVIFWARQRPVGQLYARAAGNGLLRPRALMREAVDGEALAAARLAACAVPSATVSVVICTRDRPDALARCLASLQAQSRRPDQVVVVDNASRDDRTRQVALAAGAGYVREDRPGLDIARNAGAHAAAGEIVAYTDDDVTLHPRWLARIAAAFDAPDIMAVTGLVLPAELETAAQQLFERHWGFGRGFRRLDFGSAYFARHRAHGCPTWEIGAGANMAFRREAFDRIGLFDERLDVGAAGCSGDSEYWYRVLAGGWRCRYEPSAVVFHFHRRDFDALRRQIAAYMRGHAAALLIQFERCGDWGNLRRLLLTLPAWYGRRVLRRLVRGRDSSNCLLGAEIRGCLSGIAFYLGTPQPPRCVRS